MHRFRPAWYTANTVPLFFPSAATEYHSIAVRVLVSGCAFVGIELGRRHLLEARLKERLETLLPIFALGNQKTRKCSGVGAGGTTDSSRRAVNSNW